MKLYTATQAATAAGRTCSAIHYYRQRGMLPHPTHTKDGGHKLFYTSAEVQRIKGFFKTPRVSSKARAGYVTRTQAAIMWGATVHIIRHWLTKGYLAEPTHKLPCGAATYYTLEDVERLRPVVEWRLNHKGNHPVQPDGYYSVRKAADTLDMPYVTLRSWLDSHKIPHPTRTVKGFTYRVWNEADLKLIQKTMRRYFAKRIKM